MNDTEIQIQNLLIAVVKMEEVQENTNGNVDRIINHLDKPLSPWKLWLIVTAITSLIGFNSYLLLEYQNLRLDIDSMKIVHKTDIEKIEVKHTTDIEKLEVIFKGAQKKINKNLNQITYLKGAKQNKPRGNN